MKTFKSLFTITLISLVLVTGCNEDYRSDDPVVPNAHRGQSASRISAETINRINAMRAALPPGAVEQFAQKVKIVLEQHPEYRAAVLRALGVVEPTECDWNTDLNVWINQELSDWGQFEFEYAFWYTPLAFLAFDDAVFFSNSSQGQYFGKNGEYTQVLTKTFKDLKRFWNIDSQGIVLVGAHGSILRDRAILMRGLTQIYGVPFEIAEDIADLMLVLLEEVPQYRNGEHPVLTFNAFAVPSFTLPTGPLPDKIVMGDGIMEAFTALGYGDVAPQLILAHEFGHHIQFDLELIGEATPENTRRTELMADAFSSYYLCHARGATMQWKRVKQILATSFNVGDCGFDSPGHHGTPLQRMAAAEWAYKLADNAKKQGKILTAEEFVSLFDAALPSLVAP